MIERISANPTIKTHFLPVDCEDGCVISFWFDIVADGVSLSSEVLPAQVQKDGKLLRVLGEREFCSEDVAARLARARAALALGCRQPEAAYELLEREMATRDFFALFARCVITLTPADSSDDRCYAIYRGTVWSCAQELTLNQWSILADGFIERQPIEVRRYSRRTAVGYETTRCDRGLELTFKVTSLTASFRSSDTITYRATNEWITEQARLRMALEAYNAVLAEVEVRYPLSLKTLCPEDLTACQAQENSESNAVQPTVDEWKNANLAHINQRLDESDYYARSAGVVPTPLKFREQLSRDIGGPCLTLLNCIAQVKLQIDKLYERLRQEGQAQGVFQIPAEPVMLTRMDSSSDRAYTLYRGIVWESPRPLLPGQWRALADSRLADEETALAREVAQAVESKPPSAEITQGRPGIPSAVRRAVWARDNGRCSQCGSRERLEYDHIIPISKGGSNTERNIELLCEGCNRAKADSIT